MIFSLKQLIITVVAFALLQDALGQTSTPPNTGSGTSSDPYEIATWENLYWLSQNSGEWNKHFVQTAHIEFPSDINTWNSNAGWTPIGNTSTRFTGTYDGGAYTVSNLYLNRPSTDRQGLFGQTDGATISNLGLFNLDVAGRNRIGGLIGDALGGTTIDNVFVEGAITGGNDAIGGLIGHTSSATEISQSFTVGSVNASGVSIGGLVGGNLGKIENSFSLSAVTVSGSSDNRIGGLVGHNFGGQIIRSFSAGAVSASNGGGLVGLSNNGASITDSYWDNQTSTKTSSAGGTGLSTTQMRDASNFTNWDFTNDWKMSSTLSFNGYPVLEWTKSYPKEPSIVNGKRQIDDLANLLWMTDATSRWGDDYEQTADIDMIIVRLWDEGKGWTPIGNNTNRFTGSYDGDDHTISNLYINNSALRHAGLFGFAENATFENLEITGSITADWDLGGLVGQTNGNSLIRNVHTDVEITVRESGGGIVGHNQGLIENSSAAGNITGSTGNNMGGLVAYHNGGTIKTSFATGNVTSSNGSQVGGLVGAMLGTGTRVENSYATGNVNAPNNAGNGGAGGLIGRIRTSGLTVENSYSVGEVTASGSIGGLIGVRSSSTVTNSFWDNQTSNQTSSDGGSGKSTSEMQQQATFTNWDFQCESTNGTAYIWGIDEGNNYPVLSWEGFVQPCTAVGAITISTDASSNVEDWVLFNGVLLPIQNNPTVNVSQVEAYLNSAGSLRIEAQGDVNINADVTYNGSTATLTLKSNNGEVKINSNIDVHHFALESSAELAPAKFINAKGNFTHDGPVKLAASSSDYSQLRFSGVYSGSNGNVTQQKSLHANWNLLGASMNATTAGFFGDVGSSGATHTTNTQNLFSWNGENYVNLPDNSEGITPGQGYFGFVGQYGVRSNAGIHSFAGAPNTSVNIPLLYDNTFVADNAVTISNGLDREGWNLLANPFTCNLDIASVSRSGFNNAFYLYDGTNYTAIAPGGIVDGVIPPLSAFWMQANDASPDLGGGNLSMGVDGTVSATGSGFARHALDRLVLRTYALGDTIHTDYTVVSFIEGTTDGFDGEWDAHKMEKHVDYPNIYSTHTDGSTMAINAIPYGPSHSDKKTVPVAFKANQHGANFTIRYDDQYMINTYAVYLEDKLEGTFTDMSAQDHTFINDTSMTDRFVLHFRAGALSIDAEDVLSSHSGVKAWI
ncbi:MAG: hypothetical protein LAT54_08240, partial [Cryomorphaceae bacterium]|nr:hypothetical protein [Cryomorphaceae bacterium]